VNGEDSKWTLFIHPRIPKLDIQWMLHNVNDVWGAPSCGKAMLTVPQAVQKLNLVACPNAHRCLLFCGRERTWLDACRATNGTHIVVVSFRSIIPFTLKMEAVRFPETLVSYNTIRCHNPEDLNLNLRRENLT
jgi:hypothetical protein